ncbi:MAG: hypothetical protein KDA90_18255 [Planctomycetaceae bacterium]|nr:hypothetical protein [Planctomycetaceae bacterium]
MDVSEFECSLGIQKPSFVLRIRQPAKCFEWTGVRGSLSKIVTTGTTIAPDAGLQVGKSRAFSLPEGGAVDDTGSCIDVKQFPGIDVVVKWNSI